jgi:hypothetical protein
MNQVPQDLTAVDAAELAVQRVSATSFSPRTFGAGQPQQRGA